jgi:hypothetical protein
VEDDDVLHGEDDEGHMNGSETDVEAEAASGKLKRCRLLCLCSLYIKGLATCVGSPFESAGKENIGQCRVKNPLYLIVKSGKGNSSKWINPYWVYLQGTILHIFVVAYPFLDSIFPDLAAGAEALCSLYVVHHNLGQVNPSDSTVPSHASSPPAAYVNTARTNGTIEQKFQVLKSSYAGVLPGKKHVRMDTFVLHFYTWYKRHMNAVLEHCGSFLQEIQPARTATSEQHCIAKPLKEVWPGCCCYGTNHF